VQLQDDEQALNSYKAALESVPYLDQSFALREKIADVHLRNAAYDLAVAQYEKILGAAQLDAYRAQIEYLLGQAHLLAADADGAYLHWSTAVELYPRAHHAYLSLVELVDAGVEVDEFQRGMVDYYAGAYGPAVQALYRYLESDATERRDEARYYIGRAYHLSGSYDLAIKAYDVLIAAYPDSSAAVDAWLEKGRSLAAQSRIDEATETLEAFVEAYPDHELAPEALWRMARQNEGVAAWAKAASAYRRLQENYPASERAGESLARAGLSHFRLADQEAAIVDWRKLVTEYPDSGRLSATRYWLGRAYSALGNDAEAGEWLTLAAESPALLPNYYALRASHRLETLKAGSSTDSLVESWPLAQPSLLLDFEGATARAEAEAWLLDWAGPEEEAKDSSGLMDVLAQDPRYQRGVEYLAVGLGQEALDEFEAMRVAWRDDPLVMYGLALASQELGVYKTSIRCALQVVNLSPVDDISRAPIFLQRLAYPIYFDGLVLAEAAANDLDPLLIFALIRQESLFESSARSYAEASGLMQVMPSTGEWIALRLGWEDFVPEHLARPYVNVHFGTWYLVQGLGAFQGNVFAALAAYNSGIGAPGRWLDASGDDPDLFVETIDYSQTLHYVQLVYQHHALYRQIYQPGS
jgi:soluble lytic murein transglycosylase